MSEDKHEEMVLVADRKNLEELDSFRNLSGFREAGEDEIQEILSVAYFARRGKVENDPSRKQIIPYTVVQAWPKPRPVCNFGPAGMVSHDTVQDGIKTLSYCRAGGEGRLLRLRSIGLGGHVNPNPVFETTQLLLPVSSEDPRRGVYCPMSLARLAEEANREIEEELETWDLPFVRKLIGLVNHEDDPVGQVHLGVVYTLELPSSILYQTPKARDQALSGLSWESAEDLLARVGDYEKWSQILIKV